MAEESEKQPASEKDKVGEFFNVGAPLNAVRPGYVRRPADELLYNTAVAGRYAHIMAPDRMGKTSLISSVSARLQNNGCKVAVLDLAQISERDGGSDAGRWYYSIAYRLSRQLRMKIDLQVWWQDHAILSNRQRLVEYYAQVILKNIEERIVVFVDGVQFITELPFAAHLLASIRAAHNSRITEPEFNRLGFVMLGDCDPHGLVSDPQLSPFAVSTEIPLNDFTREDLDIFAAELHLPVDSADEALDRIFYWTNGQPYLTQKLSRAVAREQVDGDIGEAVDKLALQQLAGRSARSSEPHLSRLQRAVIGDEKNAEALLTLYGRIRKGITVTCDHDLFAHRRLLAIGLVVTNDAGNFALRNRIYESVFTASWANEHLPLRWRGPAIAALIFFALTAIPFTYTQLLPKPYLQVMGDPTYDLETVSDAYQNLRSFPGHTAAADRMFRSVLEHRARQSADRRAIDEVSRYARLLPGGDVLGDDLSADFWDRRTADAMRREQRDEAVLSSLEALVVTTQSRRRRAATLIGDDYSQLLATVPQTEMSGMVFSAENTLLTRYQGAEVSQWAATAQGVESRPQWSMSALEISPLVRRVIVDRQGSASRVGLTVNVSHSRLDDLRMRLIAPSGRAAEISIAEESSAANEEIRIAAAQLNSLRGESLSGTWSLSLRDEATGVTGHLVGWKLSLNSQVVVENFQRGLDVPDPVERPSENLWFSPDGRYAIARALQSDSARLWDLNYARAARTISVPASERVVGLSANAAYLVTATQNTVNLWRTSDGRRHAVLDVGDAISDIVLSADGMHLLTSNRSDADTRYEVWSIESGTVLADLDVAGTPALTSISAAATHLAVADFDRAVRIWNLRDGALLAQIDLGFQPSEIALSASGEQLGVVLGEQGVALWDIDNADAPLFSETRAGEWHMAFSPSGARFMAGNQREGMQIYRSADGVASGLLLDPGLQPIADKLFAFSFDETLVVSAGSGDVARFWSVPSVSAGSNTDFAGADIQTRSLASDDGVTVSAIAPGGERLAVGDHSGHIHIRQIDTTAGNVVAGSEDVSFLGHRDAVMSVEFSSDGALVASAGADGTIRIWDGYSGSPRSFYGKAEFARIDRMIFSPDASQLAVLGGQRVWLMNTEDGSELANVELGQAQSDLAFAANGQLYVAGESGALQNLYSDRTNNWHVRSVWQGLQPLRRMDIAPNREVIVLVDALNEVRLLDPRDGRVGTYVLKLPGAASDIAFSPNEARVLFRTGRWIHRALVTPAGPVWTDSLRAPKALNGSRMAFDSAGTDTSHAGDCVLLLTSDRGQTALAELQFDYAAGPGLFGTRESLLRQWTQNIEGQPNTNDFVREGF